MGTLFARMHTLARPARQAFLLGIVACALFAGPACGDPCRELSEAICRCSPSKADEQRCLRHVRSLAAQKHYAKTAASQAQCVGYLATCSCQALADGNLTACGLSDTD